jgi:transcription elongation factor GreB
MDRPNYITPAGYSALKAEYDALFAGERPKLVETISWAAGNGDRSENGDYIYGRKRLREIDRRLGFLSRRMKAAKVVDPAKQEDRSRVFFGATVIVADEDDNHRIARRRRR